jgi:hypothetical protein
MDKDFATIPDVSVVPTSDRITPNQVASGMTRGIQQLGSDKVYSDGGNQQIIVEDSNEPRVMMGNHATFGEGFYVSKDGTNVKTNTNPANLIFNSSQNAFKIVSAATVSHTLTNAANVVSAGTQTKSIAHGLSFIPAFLVYVTTNAGYIDGTLLFMLPEMSVLPAGHALGGGTIFSKFYATVDATSLNINYFHRVNTDYSPSVPTFTVRYYLLQESAS